MELLAVPVPTIAVINGPAIGAGACLAMGCDMRIASENAKIGFNFVNLGIPPGMGGTFTLPILIGIQNAARLLLTGEIMDSKSSKELGLVMDVVSDPLEIARKIAMVHATTKTLRMRYFDGSFERAMQREADTQAICFMGPDFKKRLKALSCETKAKTIRKLKGAVFS